MNRRHCPFGAAFLLLIMVGLAAFPAPALKPEPPRDTLTGELAVQLGSPVLIVGEERKVYWIVFTGRPFALGQLGDRITVGGRIGEGGMYSYVVAEIVK